MAVSKKTQSKPRLVKRTSRKRRSQTYVTIPYSTLASFSIGLAAVIFFVVGYFYSLHTSSYQHPTKQVLSNIKTLTVKPTKSPLKAHQVSQKQPAVVKATVYVVKQGDTLWSLSESSYGTGFSWHVIADANKITSPVTLSVGQKLIIPRHAEVAQKPAVQSQQNTTQMHPAQPTTYIVKHGDSLWSIALQVYNDGYQWTQIAKVNNLQNPGLIFAGNKLIIPNAPNSHSLSDSRH